MAPLLQDSMATPVILLVFPRDQDLKGFQMPAAMVGFTSSHDKIQKQEGRGEGSLLGPLSYQEDYLFPEALSRLPLISLARIGPHAHA